MEAGPIAVALSPLKPNITLPWWIAAVVVLFAVLFGGVISQQYGFNLRERTSEPHLAWLYIHALYWFTGVVNGFVLLGFFLYVFLGGAFVVNWPLILAGAMIVWWYVTYYLLLVAGQGYETFEGACFVGASAFARLSRGLLAAQKRQGIALLHRSLKMAKALFERRRYVPTNLDAVYATVVGLSETDNIPFDELADLARALEPLPNPDRIPAQFETFLNTMKWPRGFERRQSQRLSDYPRLNILLLATGAIAALVALSPEGARQVILESIAGFASQNIMHLFTIALFLLALRFITYAVRYPVYPLTLQLARKHWPSEKSEREAANSRQTALWRKRAQAKEE